MTTLVAPLLGLIVTVLSVHRAVVDFHCDDHAITQVSQDGGPTWSTIDPADMGNTNSFWKRHYHLALDNVGCDTIVKILCGDLGNGPSGSKDVGGFMGDVHYNGVDYYTNEYVGQGVSECYQHFWQLESSNDADDLEYSARQALPWDRKANHFNPNAKWVWNGRPVLIFRFDFGDLCDARCCIDPDDKENACSELGNGKYASCADKDRYIECIHGGTQALDRPTAPGTCWDACNNGQKHDGSQPGVPAHPACQASVPKCVYGK